MKQPPIPTAIKTAITSSVGVMLASLAIPQNQIDGGLAALFLELEGKGAKSLTNREPLDRVLSVKQAAEIIGKSARTIRTMAKDGTLRGVYGGTDKSRITGISEASVRAFMANGKAVAA